MLCCDINLPQIGCFLIVFFLVVTRFSEKFVKMVNTLSNEI